MPVCEPEYLAAVAGAYLFRFICIEDSVAVRYIYLFNSILDRSGIFIITPYVVKCSVPVVGGGYFGSRDKLTVTVELNGYTLRTDAVVIVKVVPNLIQLY